MDKFKKWKTHHKNLKHLTDLIDPTSQNLSTWHISALNSLDNQLTNLEYLLNTTTPNPDLKEKWLIKLSNLQIEFCEIYESNRSVLVLNHHKRYKQIQSPIRSY